ncbi:MAG TPA: DUF3261 domain-containing protein [Myxococcota bacterium]|nr:DUF3261 domain-containing protein [Myxococcota bacterium]
MSRRGAALALCAAAWACKTLAPVEMVVHPPPRLGDCPGELRSTREIEGDWTVHGRIHVSGGGVDESYQLVLQKTGPRLVLLALTPFGAKAFAVTQIGLQTWSESYLGPILPVPPENVLRDVHRAWFRAVDDPALDPRALAREPDGAVHVRAEQCGYEATLAAISANLPGRH